MFQGYDCGSIVFQRQAANANSDGSECQLIVYKQLLNLDTNSIYSFQVTKASTAKHDAFLHHLHTNQVKQHALTITMDKRTPSKWLCKIMQTLNLNFQGSRQNPSISLTNDQVANLDRRLSTVWTRALAWTRLGVMLLGASVKLTAGEKWWSTTTLQLPVSVAREHPAQSTHSWTQKGTPDFVHIS